MSKFDETTDRQQLFRSPFIKYIQGNNASLAMVVDSSYWIANLVTFGVATHCSAQSPAVQSIRRLTLSLDNGIVFIFSAWLFPRWSKRTSIKTGLIKVSTMLCSFFCFEIVRLPINEASVFSSTASIRFWRTAQSSSGVWPDSLVVFATTKQNNTKKKFLFE